MSIDPTRLMAVPASMYEGGLASSPIPPAPPGARIVRPSARATQIVDTRTAVWVGGEAGLRVAARTRRPSSALPRAAFVPDADEASPDAA